MKDDVSDLESVILKESCEASYVTGQNMINPMQLFGENPLFSDCCESIRAAIDTLAGKGLIYKIDYRLGGQDDYCCRYRITTRGYYYYAVAFMADFATQMDAMLEALLVKRINNNRALSGYLGEPQQKINFMLEMLQQAKHIRLGSPFNGLVEVYEVNPIQSLE